MVTDDFTIVHPCAAGLDVHKMQITAAVRQQTSTGASTVATRAFSALPQGLSDLCAWLRDQQVTAAVMEATGIYRDAPFAALEDAGIPVRFVNAHHVKQLKRQKTDIADSTWLARVCQFDLVQGSMVPPREFRELRHVSRHRRRLTQQRASVRNRIHKVLDRSGCRLGGILTDIFGMNGRRILNGLVEGVAPATILETLSYHVDRHLDALDDALSLSLTALDRELVRDFLVEHDQLDRRIEQFYQTMQDGLAPWQPQLDLLQTMPGIDEPAACEIFIELGPDLTVFGNARRLAAWAGVCPGNHESAGKRRTVSTRRGSRHLASVLNQSAHAATRTKDCVTRHRNCRANDTETAACHVGGLARRTALHRSHGRLRGADD